MSGINLNFTGVEDVNFDPIPVGTYHASIFEVEIKDSKSSDYQYLNVQYKLLEGKAADGSKIANRRAFAIYSFAPKALFGLKGLLVASETKTAEELQGSLAFEPNELLGKVVRIKIGHQMYEGEIQERVKGVLKAAPDFDPHAAGGDTSAPASGAPDLSNTSKPDLDGALPFELE